MNSRRPRSRSRQCQHPAVRGFTLVELLVSVALVALMMLLFAQVFQLAAGSVTQQKGMAELDQRERMLVTILRGDLDQRSFRVISPFPAIPGDRPLPATGSFDWTEREGYFSISENDINDHTDDVLQFTIKQDPSDPETREELPFSGRATLLKVDTADPDDYDTESERNSQLLAAQDQPEFDDGVGVENGVGSSKAAEVSYFLRNGTLYRRVLLIRDVFTDAGGTNEQPVQLEGGENYNSNFVGSLTTATEPGTGIGTFWHDFDYSAYHNISDNNVLLQFNHLGSLDNRPASISPLGAIAGFGTVPASLGIPHLRFGHGLFDNTGSVLDGRPREYDSSSPQQWIGRYTMRETADPNFGYPGRIPQVSGSDASPMDPATTTTINSEGAVDEYKNGDRGGEDILLTNVHEFDIKVFDDYVEDQNGNGTLDTGEDANSNGNRDTLNKFVDLGHSEETAGGDPVGYYHNAQNAGSQGNRFDTWHPSMPDSTAPTPLPPPYRPIRPGSAGTWPDEEAPLRAISIRIRYLDVKSNQMRQVTLGYTFE